MPDIIVILIKKIIFITYIILYTDKPVNIS